MAKFINRQIKIKSDERDKPGAFYWKGRWVPVNRILEMWKDTGAWWDGEAEKTFYRVEGAGKSIYELYLDSLNKEWVLYRIYD